MYVDSDCGTANNFESVGLSDVSGSLFSCVERMTRGGHWHRETPG